MEETGKLLDGYAELLLRSGVNLQRGQTLVVECPVERADFTRLCVKKAYDMGCREAIVRWQDDFLTREKFMRAEDSVFGSAHSWDADFYNSVSAEGAAFLAIHAGDPENLAGVDSGRIKRAQAASGAAMAPFRERETNNAFPWCVCAAAGKKWAKKVYPRDGEDEAVEKLWRAILRASRADGGDAVKNWKKHSDELHERCEKLNALKLKTLYYRNSLGTALSVELPEGHFWAGGDEKCKSGAAFSANIPSEEVFTLPKKTGVNGVVFASRPLSLNGNLIEGIRLELRDGKIVSASADRGADVLRDAIAIDEGASYFGEAALVPCDSPISNEGTLFYSTLFDENASCHFAFGEAYPCIRDAENMSREELEARGVNFSITHVDFMVGTPDLSIRGETAGGRTLDIFRDGNFAI
jgi:aminopeptidase